VDKKTQLKRTRVGVVSCLSTSSFLVCLLVYGETNYKVDLSHIVFRVDVVRYAAHVCSEKMEQYIRPARAPTGQITGRGPECGRCKSKSLLGCVSYERTAISTCWRHCL